MTPLRPRWSRSSDARLIGLALAREANRLLAWDEGRSLYLWDLDGKLHARHTLLQPPLRAAISDDGGQVLVADRAGGLTWLDHALQLRFSHDPPALGRVMEVALEALGQYAAISTAEQRTFILTRTGQPVATIETPRPLKHLAFVSSLGCLLGAADFGYVGGFDAKGQRVWQEAPVSHIGAIDADGAGQAWLACFSNGVQRYDSCGRNLGILVTPQPCRLVRVDWAGERILVCDDAGTLSLLKADGAVLGELPTNRAVSALCLGALGDIGAYAHAEGTLTLVELP